MNTYMPLAWQRLAHEAATRVQAIHAQLDQCPGLLWAPHVQGPSRKQRARQQQQRLSLEAECSDWGEAGSFAQFEEPSSPVRASHGDGTTEAPGDRLHRLAIGRWVLTQKMLHQERRLSAGQHRYLSLLGLSWLVSSRAAVMSSSVWRQQHAELLAWVGAASAASAASPHLLAPPLADWLKYQQSLEALGVLEAWKRQALQDSLAGSVIIH
ncbi:hypothetical protein WJX84_009055 [Apatococcus fuscideae]|uniref:Uncharacterized protein n=1 Tax=Apatococcus fuscideae TaxID=2026836 RepID=A0AAW1SXL2_9CHLO